MYFKFAPSAILAQKPCVVVCGTKDFFQFAGAPAKRIQKDSFKAVESFQLLRCGCHGRITQAGHR